MRSPRLPVVLLLLGTVACGQRSRSAAAGTPRRAADGPAIASSLDVRLDDAVTFALHVTNNADRRLEVRFPSGMTHDVVVLDAQEREVWRWSAGRLFTQALRNDVLDARETASYGAEWDSQAHHGTFTAVASLTSDNVPVQQRVRFTIP